MTDSGDILKGKHDEDEGPRRAAETVPTGNVSVAMTGRDGSVITVRTAGEVGLLTIAGADGMVTARLSNLDLNLLGDLLSKAQIDTGRARRGDV